MEQEGVRGAPHQSESKMMHVSAATRLMPRPPARVESRKQSMLLSWLKSFIAFMPVVEK